MAVTKSQERIYSPHQLVTALRSGFSAVREQLQVLAILDSTATSWPGLNQSLDDCEFLVDMTAQTTGKLESKIYTTENKVQEYEHQIAQLTDTMEQANQSCEALRSDLSEANHNVKQLTHKLDTANKDISCLRKEVAALEKARRDLEAEVERRRSENEQMDGEIRGLRDMNTDQASQITVLKEEVAARCSDVSHLTQRNGEQRQQIEHQRRNLEHTTESLRQTQFQLDQMRSDKEHFERESYRLGDEAARTGAALATANKEIARLKDWQEVMKKMEADKLREEQMAHAKCKSDWGQKYAALEKRTALLYHESSHREAQIKAKTVELETVKKQAQMSQIQIRDLQKQLAGLAVEKAAALSSRDEARTQISNLQKQIQQIKIDQVRIDKERAVNEGRVREAAAAERARLAAAAEEHKKEAHVQKLLADGYARDIAELKSNLKEEHAKAENARLKMEAMAKEGEQGKFTNFRNQTTNETLIQSLRLQLDTCDAELKRVKAQAMSTEKAFQKQVESLQRECNESAAEVQRFRRGEGLPPPRPLPTLQDDLTNLKRLVQSKSSVGPQPGQVNRGSPVSLPPAIKGAVPIPRNQTR